MIKKFRKPKSRKNLNLTHFHLLLLVLGVCNEWPVLYLCSDTSPLPAHCPISHQTPSNFSLPASLLLYTWAGQGAGLTLCGRGWCVAMTTGNLAEVITDNPSKQACLRKGRGKGKGRGRGRRERKRETRKHLPLLLFLKMILWTSYPNVSMLSKSRYVQHC